MCDLWSASCYCICFHCRVVASPWLYVWIRLGIVVPVPLLNKRPLDAHRRPSTMWHILAEHQPKFKQFRKFHLVECGFVFLRQRGWSCFTYDALILHFPYCLFVDFISQNWCLRYWLLNCCMAYRSFNSGIGLPTSTVALVCTACHCSVNVLSKTLMSAD